MSCWLPEMDPRQVVRSFEYLRSAHAGSVEYLYTGVMADIKEQDMLLHILHLAHRWELPSLFEVMQIKLVEYISLDTYDMRKSLYNDRNFLTNNTTILVLEEAEERGADILTDNCNMFEKDNQDAIKRFKGY